jgi:oxygen-dependent protoporphyrinogen oxidase
MAQYHLGHSARVAHIRDLARVYPALALCGNAYEGAGLPDCVRGGETAADDLSRQLLPTHTGAARP